MLYAPMRAGAALENGGGPCAARPDLPFASSFVGNSFQYNKVLRGPLKIPFCALARSFETNSFVKALQYNKVFFGFTSSLSSKIASQEDKSEFLEVPSSLAQNSLPILYPCHLRFLEKPKHCFLLSMIGRLRCNRYTVRQNLYPRGYFPYE